MKYGSIKPFKFLAKHAFDVLSLFHQTSDKKLPWRNGKGQKFLTEFETWSSGSSDLHSGRAEVGTESLLSKFINPKVDR